MKTIKELNEKVWYRALKVIFLTFLILMSLFIMLLSLGSFPVKKINWDKTKLICNNGKIYDAKTKDYFLWGRGYGSSDYIDTSDDAKIKKICEYNIIDSNPLSEKYYKIPESNNYTIEWEYTWEPSLLDFILTVINRIFWGAVIFYVLVFEFLRKIFYYIVFGTANPKKDYN